MADAGRFRAMARGFTRRCARCGSGHLFRHWFTMVEDCPGCDLHFEREHGYFAGALAINIMAAIIVFAVAFIGGLLVLWPDVPVAGFMVALIVLMTAFPIFFYPFSKTIWVAVDRSFLQQLDGAEVLDEQVGRRSAATAATPPRNRASGPSSG